jgi:hypothetical protein
MSPRKLKEDQLFHLHLLKLVPLKTREGVSMQPSRPWDKLVTTSRSILNQQSGRHICTPESKCSQWS